MDRYLNKTYLGDKDRDWTQTQLDEWKEKECPKGNHLWDEVLSTKRHYLFCDACEKIEKDLTIKVPKRKPLR